MWVASPDDNSFQLMEWLIRLLPVGVLLGLAVVLLLRWLNSRRVSSIQAKVHHKAQPKSPADSSANDLSRIVPMLGILIDAALWLYLLVHYEWGRSLEQFQSIGSYALLWIVAPGIPLATLVPVILAALFFAWLAGGIFMSRFYVGRWPELFKLGCLGIFPIVLLWLVYTWAETAWGLAQTFPSDLPRGLQDLLIAGLFSACNSRIHNNDTAVAVGPSAGMYLLEWLAAIYLAEKYLRLAMFHKRRDEQGYGRWIRFVPVLPALLSIGFVGWGLWGDLQRTRLVLQMEGQEMVVLQPKGPHLLWHNAVAQCADQGSEWRLPTTHELRVLSRGRLGSEAKISSAWAGEAVPNYGPRDLRWGKAQGSLPSYVPNVLGSCLSGQPIDLYQQIVVRFYPALYQEHRGDSFYRYFYPDSHAETLPTAVLCIRSNDEMERNAVSHLVKDALLIKDLPTALSLVDSLCASKKYAPSHCTKAEADRVEDLRDNDPEKSAEEFEARQEKCRLTNDPEHCTGHGWYYRVRGEFEKSLVFFEAGCSKGHGNACLEIDDIKKEQVEFKERTDELVQLGYVAKAPLRHREAKEPLAHACEQGHAAQCLYRGGIAEWENQQEVAKRFYAKGCTGGILLACTKQVNMEWASTMIKDYETAIIPKYADLCEKKEVLACLRLAGMLSDKIRGERASEGIALAKQRCAEGMSSLCEFYENSTNSSRLYVPDEMQPNDVRPDSPYDIERLRAECRRYALNCKGYVERLTNQGQFKEAEWFREQACIEEKAQDVKLCSQLLPWRNRHAHMVQLLKKKQYLTVDLPNHEVMVPSLKRACHEGVKDACLYLGNLMEDVMTERSEGGHSQYSLAGLMKPFERACQLDDVSACKHALDLAREWREGRYSAEKERHRRPATVEETKAYGRLCEERNYAGACWEVLQPWLEDRKQDHRQVPDHLAPAWRYSERQCEKNKDAVACWTLVKPWIDFLEHDHSKLPKDRGSIRKQLERICEIEVEEGGADKRACRELQRYIDLHWL